MVAEITGAHRKLLQLYAGLAMLDRVGAIRLSQRIVRPESHRGTCILRVNDASLVVDTRDAQELIEPLTKSADFYAKRSFRCGGYGITAPAVISYGLNYAVLPPGPDIRALRRIRLPGSGHGVGGVARALAVDRVVRWPMTPRVSHIRPHPIRVKADSPQVVFFARVWSRLPDGQRTVVAELEALNEQRAACIRSLRKEFGPRFVGGLEPSALATRYFSDCLADRSQTAKLRYLRLAREVPIGVATTGLSSSIGWKFAEYVAMGRAIATEPLLNEVPGSLSAGTNYVTFQTADECVDACRELVDDPERVASMSAANTAYYERFLRPDRLVGNLLHRVVGETA